MMVERIRNCLKVGILHLVTDVIAPLPPCTPFLWVNKMIESNNWTSDMNPYYPVKPCPYKDPDKAPPRLRFAIFSGPKKLLYHVGTELKWFFTTGFPRLTRMMVGREKFRMNPKILREGQSSHHTEKTRTRHFGRKTYKSKAYYPNYPKNRVNRNYWFDTKKAVWRKYRQKRRRKSRIQRPWSNHPFRKKNCEFTVGNFTKQSR